MTVSKIAFHAGSYEISLTGSGCSVWSVRQDLPARRLGRALAREIAAAAGLAYERVNAMPSAVDRDPIDGYGEAEVLAKGNGETASRRRTILPWDVEVKTKVGGKSNTGQMLLEACILLLSVYLQQYPIPFEYWMA